MAAIACSTSQVNFYIPIHLQKPITFTDAASVMSSTWTPRLRSDWEDAARDSLEVEEIDFSQYDFVVVGSVSRNMRLTETVLKKFPASKTVLIHGEDTPPTIAAAHFLRSTKAHVFIRSIY